MTLSWFNDYSAGGPLIFEYTVPYIEQLSCSREVNYCKQFRPKNEAQSIWNTLEFLDFPPRALEVFSYSSS